MKSGSSDTHTLAEAAKKQSEKMSNVSDAADRIGQAAQDMVIQDQRIADNSKNAIEASSKQNSTALGVTINASRLEQRAWVGISVVQLPIPLPAGKTFEIVNHCPNTGKTPAIRPHAVSEIEIDVPNKPPIYEETDAPEGPPLLPGAELTATVSMPILNDEAIASFKNGKLLIYDRGAVWYWDVFGRKHISTFCLAYNPASGAFHADPKIPCKKQEAN